jgi:hypothetical protein
VNTEIRILASLALSACILAVSGCVDKSNPDMVDKRSVERWNFLVAHEAEKAYDYLTPGYRTTKPRDAYATSMNNRPVQWKAAKFVDKKCEQARCSVNIAVTYAVTLPGTPKATEVTSQQNETWLLINGEWFFLPSN